MAGLTPLVLMMLIAVASALQPPTWTPRGTANLFHQRSNFIGGYALTAPCCPKGTIACTWPDCSSTVKASQQCSDPSWAGFKYELGQGICCLPGWTGQKSPSGPGQYFCTPGPNASDACPAAPSPAPTSQSPQPAPTTPVNTPTVQPVVAQPTPVTSVNSPPPSANPVIASPSPVTLKTTPILSLVPIPPTSSSFPTSTSSPSSPSSTFSTQLSTSTSTSQTTSASAPTSTNLASSQQNSIIPHPTLNAVEPSTSITPGSQTLSTGQILGIVFGVLSAATFLLLLPWLWRRLWGPGRILPPGDQMYAPPGEEDAYQETEEQQRQREERFEGGNRQELLPDRRSQAQGTYSRAPSTVGNLGFADRPYSRSPTRHSQISGFKYISPISGDQ
ncbi:hypothetical protein B0H63DRAFT_529699 [Podospora didyma]|uniref:Uncharacterized protein n=1 Tax=Podospora didyma TaxID=330526 RepID=A0AAE0K1I8_9PEZI|nr:hypothetical protein B0H63DRAFT_529699 [Podospora didyma]